ncbi:Serine carboxypeptidase-like 5 [Acorus calamus]|uniref:Serine carboxypeptidase-like 5 n=1 Tax=Acorus calamus TaxID=4465 RepID=A0AAV9EMA9_ACOCL|nr:Serine carboxypeptidase-like 5 [Acorus calamus]
MKDMEDGRAKYLNLKGYVAGNPLISAKHDLNTIFPYAHRMGFISDELYKSAKKRCRGQYLEPKNAQCADDVKAMQYLISGINVHNILEKKCVAENYKFQNMLQLIGDRWLWILKGFSLLPLLILLSVAGVMDSCFPIIGRMIKL